MSDNPETKPKEPPEIEYVYNIYTLANNIKESEDFIIPDAFPYQLPFIQSYNKRRCLACGYGWGKTETLAADCVEKPLEIFERWALEYFDSLEQGYKECGGAGNLLRAFNEANGQHFYGAICGVSFERHLQDVTQKRFIRYWPIDQIKIEKHAITFYIECEPLAKYQLYGIGKQGDINSFASEEFDFIYVDEFTLIPIENLKFLETRLRKIDRPNMLTVAGVPPVLGSLHHQYLLDSKYEILNGGADLNTALDPSYYQSLLDTFPPGALRDRLVYGQIVSNDKSMFPFENIQYSTAPYYKKIVAFIDPAISENGDEFVIAVQGLSEGLVYNLDCFHATGLHINKQLEAVKSIQDKWSPHIYAMESNAYQLAGVQIFQKELPHIKGIPSIKDKVTRATNYSMAWGNNKIFWAFKDDKCTQQHMSFPNGKHDDIVDAFAGCYNLLNTSTGYTPNFNAGTRNPLGRI